ncbi:SnoK-like protein [Marinomonas sp. MED121]|uniref:phytanoyl-CoA dioxygenase family protein n=1 Tax=Marinomonas sp. MED121 TaxID=314277 RepID=UPI0000690B56|nr:phytanoyl-CoA dioxygenase family protein [Marinomonas sp. MED121]EAQ65815.1 SnoK-like protein [Marinomonas sp. MED121]
MEELKNSYEKDGFLVIPEVGLNKDVLINISASLPSILEKSKAGFPYLCFSNYGDNTKLQRVTQLHTISQILNLIINSDIGRIAAEITSSKKIKVWGSQLYIKPSGCFKNANVGIHSEYSEMPFFREGVLTAWLPLTDMNSINGTLRYLRSSHLNENYNCKASDTNLTSQKKHLENYLLYNEYDDIPVNLKLGGVSFHHNKLLHYSDINASCSSRFALAIGLMTDNLSINSDFSDYGYLKILDNLKYCPIIYQDDGCYA